MDSYLTFLRSRLGPALIVGATASLLATDRRGRVLLARRADDGLWNVPGGWVTPGESVAAAALREFTEETGWGADVTGLLGVYSEPAEQTHRYPSGDAVQFVSVFLEGVVTSAVGRHDAESTELAFFDRGHLPPDVSRSDLPALRDWAASRPKPILR